MASPNYVVSGFKTPEGVTSKEQVKAEQRKYNAETGANLVVDGVWGKYTDAAYKAYLEKQNEKNQQNGMVNMAMSGGANLSAAYDAAAEQYKAAENAAYESTKSQLNDQANKLGDQYASVRNQAYVNAKLKAIGNNEALATMGLAGNAYAGPTSGVSETSRIAQDTSMRNNINSANREEQSARDQIAQAIIQAGLTRDRNIAAQLAQLAIAKAGAVQQANLAGIQTALALNQYEDQKDQSKTTGTKSTGTGTNYTYQQYLIDQANKNLENKEKAAAISATYGPGKINYYTNR